MRKIEALNKEQELWNELLEHKEIAESIFADNVTSIYKLMDIVEEKDEEGNVISTKPRWLNEEGNPELDVVKLRRLIYHQLKDKQFFNEALVAGVTNI